LETLSAFLSQAVNIPGLYESEKNKKKFRPSKKYQKKNHKNFNPSEKYQKTFLKKTRKVWLSKEKWLKKVPNPSKVSPFFFFRIPKNSNKKLKKTSNREIN